MNELVENFSSKEVVERIAKYKADNEKKEPEVEWVWESYVVGGSDYYEASTEDEAIEWCEDRVRRFTDIKCAYERVCRVKGGANE